MHYFHDQWRNSIFFYHQDQSIFFRTLEYYYVQVDHLQFSADYFRATSYKVNKLMLPYKHFFLRAPALLYLSL